MLSLSIEGKEEKNEPLRVEGSCYPGVFISETVQYHRDQGVLKFYLFKIGPGGVGKTNLRKYLFFLQVQYLIPMVEVGANVATVAQENSTRGNALQEYGSDPRFQIDRHVLGEIGDGLNPRDHELLPRENRQGVKS